MKRYLPLLILALIFTGAVIANAQMWRLGNMVELCGGVPCEDLLGGTISKRPTEYKTNIAEQKTEGHSGTTLKVSSITTKDGNTLDPSVLGSLIVLSVNPSASNAETVVCTGLTTSTKTFTGCTFGYRFDNPTATSSANIKAHSPGEPVIISNTDTYEAQKFVTIDGDTTITASNTVSGLWQWSHSKGTCFAGTSLCIRGNGGRLEWSEDGFANSFNFTTSTGVVLTASTTLGIQVVNSQIGNNVSSTGGISFDSTGRLKILYGANSGVGTNGNGLFVERGDSYAWTGTHTFSGAGFSVFASTNTIPKTSATTSTLDRSWIPYKFGGDGTDGVLNLTSGTTTIDLGGVAVVTKNYTSINISAGAALVFTNPSSTGSVVILKSQATTTIAGNISVTSTGGAGGAARSGSTGAGTAGTSQSMYQNVFGSGAGAAASDAGAGGSVTVSTTLAFGKSSVFRRYHDIVIGAGGGSGNLENNANGNDFSGFGGRGAGALIIESNGALNFTGNIFAYGQNGGNGFTDASPGGAGGGGGGGGGYVRILYQLLIANTGTINVSGGTGGNGSVPNPGTLAGGGGGGSATPGNAGVADSGDGAQSGGNGGTGVSIVEKNEFYY